MEQERTTHGYVPYIKKEGAGFSAEDLLLCDQLIAKTRTPIMKALDDISAKLNGHYPVFTVGDYATGDGTASMGLIKEIIGVLRERHGDKLPVQVLYEDQPNNDYKSLVRRITGNNPGDPPSFLKEYPNVYALISPCDYFNLCVPPGTLDLGFSFSSMQYLTYLPCKMTNATHITHCEDKEPRELIRHFAAKEWEALLLCRAKELRIGGHFVIEMMSMDKKGKYSGYYNTKFDMFAHYDKLWRDMLNEGLITQKEYTNTNNLHYLRTQEEIKAAFNNDSGVYEAGLRLVSSDTEYLLCPHHQRWMKEPNRYDAVERREHARRLVSSVRYWINWCFAGALSEERPLAERQELADELFKRMENDVAENPDDHAYNFVFNLVQVTKV